MTCGLLGARLNGYCRMSNWGVRFAPLRPGIRTQHQQRVETAPSTRVILGYAD
jgi:hypothetical protein